MATREQLEHGGAELRRIRESVMLTPEVRDKTGSRRAFGLTQEELGLMADGLDKQSISLIERGSVAGPSMEKLVQIGDVLGLTPNQIAELFDFWHPRTEDQIDTDPHVARLVRALNQLPNVQREAVLSALETIVAVEAAK